MRKCNNYKSQTNRRHQVQRQTQIPTISQNKDKTSHTMGATTKQRMHSKQRNHRLANVIIMVFYLDGISLDTCTTVAKTSLTIILLLDTVGVKHCIS